MVQVFGFGVLTLLTFNIILLELLSLFLLCSFVEDQGEASNKDDTFHLLHKDAQKKFLVQRMRKRFRRGFVNSTS